MMNQYSHPQTYPNQTTHFHLISSAPNSNNSLNENSIYSSYQTSFYNPSITDQSYEYYSNVNEPIYHPIPSSSSFDQCQNYPTQQIYSEYHPTTTTKQSEQFNHEHKIDLNEGQYKWMQIRRAPSKTSGQLSQSPTESSNNSGRKCYSNKQLTELEKEYYSSRYLTRARRIEIARTLQMKEDQVKIWFQNRRMKDKKRKSGQTL